MGLLYNIFQYTKIIKNAKNKPTKMPQAGIEPQTLGAASRYGDHYTLSGSWVDVNGIKRV